MIFVFGSNEAGRHGAGAAKFAQQHYAAQMGTGFGPQGLSFAIPTKDWQIQTLPYEVIEHYVQRFIVYARIHDENVYKITALGTGLAGLRHDLVAAMFKHAPDHCYFDEVWKPYLGDKFNYWGTW